MWDSFLSWSLVSGNTHSADIIISDDSVKEIPISLHKYIKRTNNQNFIKFGDWSFDELNVPQYPQPRIFKNIALHLCDYIEDPNDLKLIIREKWQVYKAPVSSSFNCKQLKEMK